MSYIAFVFQELRIGSATKPQRAWTGVICCAAGVATTLKRWHSGRGVTANSTGVAMWSARPVYGWWTFTPVNKGLQSALKWMKYAVYEISNTEPSYMKHKLLIEKLNNFLYSHILRAFNSMCLEEAMCFIT